MAVRRRWRQFVWAADVRAWPVLALVDHHARGPAAALIGLPQPRTNDEDFESFGSQRFVAAARSLRRIRRMRFDTDAAYPCGQSSESRSTTRSALSMASFA